MFKNFLNLFKKKIITKAPAMEQPKENKKSKSANKVVQKKHSRVKQNESNKGKSVRAKRTFEEKTKQVKK
jgi:hypothetical protein